MIRRCTLLVAILLMVSVVTAQYHDDKYVTGGSVLFLVNGTTLAVTTLFDNAGTAYDMATDTDNKSLWFAQSTPAGLYKVDLTNGAVTTIVQSPGASNVRDMVVNQDGHLVFTTPTGLFKHTGTTFTTIAAAPTTATNWYGGLEIDIDTGRYVIQAKNSPYALLAVDDLGNMTTLATGGSPRYSITQDITSGDWYQGSFSGIYRLQKPATAFVAVTLSGSSGYYYALACDRASAAQRRIVSIHNNGSATTQLNYTDLATGVVTLKTLNTAIYNYETEFYRGNNLCTSASGTPGKWNINLSFPSDPNTVYILALSLAGVRPGVVLPAGRRINLTPDPLTVLTVNNQIPSLFNPGPNQLDANGEAKGWIDVSRLGKLGGARVWVGAILITKAGIGTIADPVGLTLP